MQHPERLVSLPLEKFHSAVAASAEEPARWVLHPQRDNLFCVLDTTEINNGRSKHRLLKVVSHAEVMEELDLDMLAQIEPVERTECSTHQALVPDRNISAAVRPPLMAVKYKKPFGQFRLFQMRFASDAGYQAALSALMQAHVPISLIANAPKSQVSVQQPWGSQSIARPIHRDAIAHLGLAQHAPTNSSFHGARFWDYTDPLINAYTNAKPADTSQPLPHTRHTRLISTAPADARSGLAPPQTTMRTYRVGSAQTSPSLTVAPPMPEPRLHQVLDQNSGPLIASQRPESDLLYDESLVPVQLQSTNADTPSYVRLPGVHSQQMSPPELPFGATASTLDFQQEMGLIMPPRRELPFPKPAQTRKPKPSHTDSRARPPISKLQLPELPKPTPRPTSKGVATLRGQSRGSDQSETVSSEKSTGKQSSPHMLPEGQCSSPPTLRAFSPKAKASPTPTDARHRRAFPGPPLPRSVPELRPKDKTTNLPASTAETIPAPRQSSPQAPLQDRDLRYMDSFIQKHMHYDQSTVPDDLSRLASLSDKDRQAEIDTMICKLIHDENFYKLLEAVENSWQRIGFDLHK